MVPIVTSPARKFASEIRACLINAADRQVLRTAPDEIFKLFKVEEGREGAVAVCSIFGGPTFDKVGAPDEHFILRSDGARLSFGVTIATSGDAMPALRAYRFQLRFPPGRVPEYIRFDLNSGHGDPLKEPRSHVHPGMEKVRIAVPIMSPMEVLAKLLFGTPGASGGSM